jgi:SAM-dependent methyltransferase
MVPSALLVAAMAVAQLFEIPPSTGPEVPFVPTPPRVVDAMLDLAGVGPGDVVYDLGCGDGRIVIGAARRGARAVGVDVDAALVAEARDAAARVGVADRVQLRVQDLFGVDLHDATVVTLYLIRRVNLALRPKLLAELRPGARVVSHQFDLGDWEPDRTVVVDGHPVYLWTMPPRRLQHAGAVPPR